MKSVLVLAVALSMSLTGCVINVRKVAEDKPNKPVERAIFFFGIPIYMGSDSTGSASCESHAGCPMKGGAGFHPPIPPPHFRPHGKSDWGEHRGHEEKKDCCKTEEGAGKKMECCKEHPDGKKMECCEKHAEGKKMECCAEGEKDKGAAKEHDHSAPDATKKK